MDDQPYDVVIVGGGAAGLSAALVLGRARRRVAVIDAGAPRNAPAAHMQGFLSRDGMPPAELLAAGRAEVTGYGVEIIEDMVVGIEPGFTVRLANGDTLTARRVLVTTGVSDELPDIPGVQERWGRDLLHCPYCHGWEVRDQPRRRARHQPRRHPPRAARAPVVRRRHLLRPHPRPVAEGPSRARRPRHQRRARRSRPAHRRGRPSDRRRARRRSDRPSGRGVHPANQHPSPRRPPRLRWGATWTTPGSSSSTAPGRPAPTVCGRLATSSTHEPRSSPPPAPARPPRSRSTPTSSKKTSPTPCAATTADRLPSPHSHRAHRMAPMAPETTLAGSQARDR